MNFNISLRSDEIEDFYREYVIDADASFLDLHNMILKSCGYPDDQMTSFFICQDDWKRRQEIIRQDVGLSEMDEDIYVMKETKLSDLILDEGQKLLYVFDPFSDRTFYLNVMDFNSGLVENKVLITKGKAPVQIAELEHDSGMDPILKDTVADSVWEEELINTDIDFDEFHLDSSSDY